MLFLVFLWIAYAYGSWNAVFWLLLVATLFALFT